MAEKKKIECAIYRFAGQPAYYRLQLGNLDITTYDTKLVNICPTLIEGLRRGQSRKLVLTQTARGIKLERAEK